MAWYGYLIGAILIVASVFIIILVLLQESNTQGLSGAIAGGADTFFGKNKGHTMQSKLKKLTTIVSIVFFVVVLAAFIILLFIA